MINDRNTEKLSPINLSKESAVPGGRSFTREQSAAIHYRGGALLVSSAAGSGKTMVLVERLLSYIEQGHNIDEFLVITYTRAAASELRQRIYERLQSRLAETPGNVHLRRQIMLCRGAYIDTIHTFCSALLREHSYLAGLSPDFRIADENESEFVKNDVLDDVFNRTYDTINEQYGLADLLEMTTSGQNDKMLSELVSNIYGRIRSIPDYDEWIKAQTEKENICDYDDISQTVYGQYLMGTLDRRITRCYEIMLAIKREIGLHPELESKYSESMEETIGSLRTLIGAMKNGWDEAVKHVNVAFPTPKPISGFDELKATRSWCRDEMKKIAKFLENSSTDHIKDMKIISPVIIMLLRLVSEVDKSFTAEKRKRGILDFSDLEHLTLSLLRDKVTGDKTAIAAATSKRFTEIMVDEYQDINEVQEMIFNALSQNGNNIFMVGDVKQSIYRFRLAEPSIFLEKYRQYGNYIYNVSEKTDEILQKTESEEDKRPIKINLSMNFRSGEGILEAVNHVFRNIMSVPFGEMEYTDAEALISGRKTEVRNTGNNGNTECKESKNSIEQIGSHEHNSQISDNNPGNCQNSEKTNNPPVELNMLSLDSITEDEEDNPKIKQIEAEYVASRIKELIDMPYMIEGKNGEYREVQYSDIAILTRSVKGSAWRYAKALSDLDIPSNLSSSEDYFDTIEVKAAVSLLSVIDNPMQDIALAAVLSGPVYEFTSDELAEIRAGNSASNYYEAIKRSTEPDVVSPITAGKCKAFLEELDELRSLVSDLPADKFIWSVYNRTGLLSRVAMMSGGERRESNLLLLAEHAKNYEKSGYKGLFNFLCYLNALQERESDISGGYDGKAGLKAGNAVRIMSIHKSKGLEFPVVFLAGTAKKHNLMDIYKSFIFHKALGIGGTITDPEKRIRYTTLARMAIAEKLKQEMLSEELRILYVAMTRAREKLIITAAFNDAQKAYDKVKILADTDGKYSPEALMSMSSIAQWLIAGLSTIENKGEVLRIIDAAISVENSEEKHLRNRFTAPITSKTREPESGNNGKMIKHFKDKNTENAASRSYKEEPAAIMKESPYEENGKQKSADKESVISEKENAIKDYASPSENKNYVPGIEKTGLSAQDAISETGKDYESKPERFRFVYPYNAATVLPSKLTVTGLKSLADPESGYAQWIYTDSSENDKFVKKPGFLSDTAEMTPAEHGTAIHNIMHHIDYDKCSNDNDVKKEVHRIIKSGHLDERIGLSLDDYAVRIVNLFKSELGKRLQRTSVSREFKFSLLTKAEQYFEGGGDDKILLQGIIDCFFEENGKLVVVDFKTDKVFGKDIDERVKKYTPQLEGYSQALERITGKQVSERIIYFFETGATVKV